MQNADCYNIRIGLVRNSAVQSKKPGSRPKPSDFFSIRLSCFCFDVGQFYGWLDINIRNHLTVRPGAQSDQFVQNNFFLSDFHPRPSHPPRCSLQLSVLFFRGKDVDQMWEFIASLQENLQHRAGIQCICVKLVNLNTQHTKLY